MFNGDLIGDPGTCYLPVFRSMKGDQNTWYLGNLFMNYFYLVFDMSPYDDFGKDYITIGVGPINPSNLIGNSSYNNSTVPVNPDDTSNTTTNGTTPPVPPTPVPPTPVPPKNDTNSTTGNDTKPVNPVKPDDGGGAIITPGGDPNEDNSSVGSWFARNKVWLIILGIILLIILLVLIYLCTRKSETDPYFAK